MRFTIAKLATLGVLSLSAIVVADQPLPTTAPAVLTSPAADWFEVKVRELGDADPSVRRRAADALIQRGASARPAVLEASRSDDPQIADSAAKVLRSLPWYSPDDPPEVQKLLEPYGRGSVADRISIVAQLPMNWPQGEPALLRLLSDELNEDICWQVEAQLDRQFDIQALKAARRFDLNTSPPAALVLAGRAWLTPFYSDKTSLPIDRDKALAMLRRAVELETAAPTNDDGQLDFAFDQLAANAVEIHQYDDAAALRRRQCKRIGVSRTTFPTPFFELLILHADFGPLAGFDDDLRVYQQNLAAPESLFILSRLYARNGQTLLAQSYNIAALAASPSQETRSAVTRFLIDHGWYDLATKECRATLSRGNANPDDDDVNARLQLSSLAAQRGDEAQAAEQMRTVLDDHRSNQNFTIARGSQEIVGPQAEVLMRIQVAQHALHAAQASGNSAEVNRQMDELLKLGPADEDAAIDLVPELKARGREADAAKLFQTVYQPLQAQIDAGSADSMAMNDIAWLCARCGEHLDQALNYSNRAVAAEPDNPAYLDTNAEAHFRVGQAAEAVRLETLALKYQPGDPFMQGQLKRFQSGLKPGGH